MYASVRLVPATNIVTSNRSPCHDMVIPTEVSRRFFFSFAPAKESAYAAEESLFDVSAWGGASLRAFARVGRFFSLEFGPTFSWSFSRAS